MKYELRHLELGGKPIFLREAPQIPHCQWVPSPSAPTIPKINVLAET